MRQKSGPVKQPATQVLKTIRRATRRHFSAEDKIRIVLEGLRGEDSIAELCRREGIVQNLYYRWSKEFLEAGKKRLAGDTARAATSDEVRDLRREAGALKEVVAELTLENRLLKKSVTAERHMRYPAAEKLGIIRLVEQSALPVPPLNNYSLRLFDAGRDACDERLLAGPVALAKARAGGRHTVEWPDGPACYY
jgi:transposase-like protein